MKSPIDDVFDKAFNSMDELETILQYIRSERDHIEMAVILESKFRMGWGQLYKLYHSTDGHCLKRGCSKETLQYWANKVQGKNKCTSSMTENKWFWKTVLKIAVKRGWAKELQKSGECRRYVFN